MPKNTAVRLSSVQRRKLLTIVRTGRHKAREILYAHILLKSAAGWTDRHTAQAFEITPKTVQRTRLRYLAGGLAAALQERERSGQPLKLTRQQETLLVALVCSKPPAGHRRWTVRLLTAEAIRREIVTEMSPETIRQMLKKTNSSRGNSKAGAAAKSHPNI